MMERLESIPRHAWSEHPHWPAQTLLLRSHENFRRISRVLVEHAAADEPLGWIITVYPQWIAAMRSHEHYEEHKLYPYLARRWELSFGTAEAGHQRLHELDRKVREALRERERGGPAPPLHAVLHAHDLALREHLDHEEELVIPALLELAPREFEDYCAMGLPELMRRLDEPH